MGEEIKVGDWVKVIGYDVAEVESDYFTLGKGYKVLEVTTDSRIIICLKNTHH